MARKLKTDWDSPAELPDQAYLKDEWQEEVDNRNKELEKMSTATKNKKDGLVPLIKASGLSERELDGKRREKRKQTQKWLKDDENKVKNPRMDFKKIHDQDLKVAQEHAKQLEAGGI